MIVVESLNWGDVDARHDAIAIPEKKLRRWIDYWFDPDDGRFDPTAEFCGIIHQLDVQPGLVGIDFETARADAMWDMLELLSTSCALHIGVSSRGD